MKIKFKATAFFLFMIILAIVLASCGQKDNKITIFESEFKDGNENIFGEFGTVISNDDSTITLIKSSENNVGPLSYFGQNEKKNSVWVNAGLQAEIDIILNPTEIETNDFFNWTFYINNKDGNILTYISVCFRKFENALRVGTSKVVSENINLSATDFNNSEAKTLTEAKNYNLICTFYSTVNNKLVCIVSIEDKNKNRIFETSPKYLLDNNNNEIEISSVGGFRCAWLDLMSTQRLTINKIRLLEN